MTGESDLRPRTGLFVLGLVSDARAGLTLDKLKGPFRSEQEAKAIAMYFADGMAQPIRVWEILEPVPTPGSDDPVNLGEVATVHPGRIVQRPETVDVTRN